MQNIKTRLKILGHRLATVLTKIKFRLNKNSDRTHYKVYVNPNTDPLLSKIMDK
jgi:hypothetical protein